MKKYLPQSLGFTLIELMVVITIIAILSTTGLVYYGNFERSSRDARRQSDLKFIQSALEDYHADQLYYPIASAVTPGSSLTGGGKTYITTVPNDPQPPASYNYAPSGCTGSQCTGYCLYAQLENTTLTSDPGCTPPTGYNYGVTRP